jgi:HlyD family secretion protein
MNDLTLNRFRIKLPGGATIYRNTLILVSLLAVSGASVVGVNKWLAASAQKNASQNRITRPVERQTLTMTIAANGTVKPERSVNLSPKTSGILKQLLVAEGDLVQQGQILAYMDDTNLQGQYTQAKANLASAQANLEQLLAGNRSQEIGQAQAKLSSAKLSLQQAEDTYQRYASLASQGAISQQSLIQYRTSRDTAAAQVQEMQQLLSLQQTGARPEAIAQARAQVEAAKGAVQTIQAQLNDTVLRAPFSGMVTSKYADPGAFVTPTTSSSAVSSATSSSILALASTNQIVANVAESAIAKIRLGQPVTIKADAYPGKTFTGKVSQISTQATVEQNVTSFQVKVALNDPNNLLRSGMNTSLQFSVGQTKDALVVPSAAVVRQQTQTGVYVIGADNQPRFQPIVVGATVSNRTQVKSGLKGNEQVMLSLPPQAQSGSQGRSGFPFPGAPRSSEQGGGQPSNAPTAAPPEGTGGSSGGPPPM